MADAEPGQIGGQLGGTVEAEILMELQAVGGAGNNGGMSLFFCFEGAALRAPDFHGPPAAPPSSAVNRPAHRPGTEATALGGALLPEDAAGRGGEAVARRCREIRRQGQLLSAAEAPAHEHCLLADELEASRIAANASEPRHDLGAARREQAAVPFEPAGMGLRCRSRPSAAWPRRRWPPPAGRECAPGSSRPGTPGTWRTPCAVPCARRRRARRQNRRRRGRAARRPILRP